MPGRLRPGGRRPARARGGRSPHDALGDAAAGAERAPGQLVFGIAQGGTDPELRRRSIEEIAALDFDGNALGGLAVGEDWDEMLDAWAGRRRCCRRSKPRYFMGIGDPEGILEVIARGSTCSTASCRPGPRERAPRSRQTVASTFATPVTRAIRRPLEDGCDCPACTRFSRAYVRHLVNQDELLGLRLLSLHNLRFVLRLTANARERSSGGSSRPFGPRRSNGSRAASEEVS